MTVFPTPLLCVLAITPAHIGVKRDDDDDRQNDASQQYVVEHDAMQICERISHYETRRSNPRQRAADILRRPSNMAFGGMRCTLTIAGDTKDGLDNGAGRDGNRAGNHVEIDTELRAEHR
jgi:hypothetical protein